MVMEWLMWCLMPWPLSPWWVLSCRSKFVLLLLRLLLLQYILMRWLMTWHVFWGEDLKWGAIWLSVEILPKHFFVSLCTMENFNWIIVLRCVRVQLHLFQLPLFTASQCDVAAVFLVFLFLLFLLLLPLQLLMRPW